MQAVRRTRRDGRTAAASDPREEPGQRSGDRRCDHRQILESLSAVSSERDLAARRRHRHQPCNHRWLGDARRRFTNSSGRSYAQRVTRRHLHSSRDRSLILLRDAGIDISRATIDGWVMRVGDLLTPLVGVMRNELLEGTYIHADETPVDVQTRDGRSRNHPGYLWQYGTPGGATIFEFRMGRGREGPMRFLEHFEGILQTDAYAAYDRVGGPKMVHAACWAHSRRRFVEATKLNQQDVASARIVAQMAKLFAIDAQARDENMDHAARHVLRMERAPLVLAELKAQIEAASRTALPSSPLGKASSYTLRLWDKLTRFLDYAELELSNNLAENSMRPVAIGRRNWTHIGHEKAGPRVAAILSIVETCRRLKIPVRQYLAALLPGLANLSIQRLPELTPTVWAVSNL